MKTSSIFLFGSRNAALAGMGRIVAILFCAVYAVRGIAGVEVTPQRIEETRTVVFHDDKVSRGPAGLKLVVELGGPEAESATESGRLKIEEAVDNTGASLIPHADAFNDPSKFTAFENAFFRNSKFRGNTEVVKPQVEFDLALPSRGAVKIAHLRGSLELSDGGKTNTAELGSLPGVGKKTIPLPNGSPVTVTVVVKDGANVTSLGLETAGEEDALASIEVVDASGKKISSGISKWSIKGGPKHESLGLSKPLDASMKLVVKVISDRKIIKVPFDLKDIPLP